MPERLGGPPPPLPDTAHDPPLDTPPQDPHKAGDPPPPWATTSDAGGCPPPSLPG